VTQTLSRESTAVVEERLRERRRRREGEPLGPAVTALAPVNAQYAADAPRLLAGPAPLATPSSTTQLGVWAQAFGEYEKRDLRSTVSFLERVQTFNLDHTTRSGGVLGGIDAVVTNVLSPNDAVVFGALAGALDSRTRFKQALTTIDLTGPSLGLYGFYALGPFSFELTFKTDFLNVDSRFADFLTATDPAAPIFGAFSGDLRNHTVVGNVKYRIDLGGAFVEPTVGVDIISSNYDARAESFGLVDGDVLRGRAGARVGTSWSLNGVVLHPTLSAFAYSNLSVSGGQVPFGDVLTDTVTKADEGKLRGEVQAALHVDFGGGFSSIARADVRFGDDYHALAGRLGLRYQW
jgi:outer membrane autotransporter protein